jgi:hypothetical protein
MSWMKDGDPPAACRENLQLSVDPAKPPHRRSPQNVDVSRRFTTMLSMDRNTNTPTHLKHSGNFTPNGIEGFDEVVENLVGKMLVEDALVAIRPKI